MGGKCCIVDYQDVEFEQLGIIKMTDLLSNTKSECITVKKRSINKMAFYFASKNGQGNGKGVHSAAKARELARQWIKTNIIGYEINLGLPEVDDRYEAWRVSLLSELSEVVGELMIRCHDGEIVQATKLSVIMSRLSPSEKANKTQFGDKNKDPDYIYSGESAVVCGDAREVLGKINDEIFDLVVTSPPYYNAKPEYSEYSNYSEYLSLLSEVFTQCHRTLKEGRFIVVNASPVLIRRPSRNKSSKRIPVPFHINNILEEIGFEFLDDIIWAKPSGAGWNTGRGRRFSADRNPLQYKPVPVTEYFLVYRKKTDKLINWNIKNHPNKEAVEQSKIEDGYEITNLWYEKPSHHPKHPATFPLEIISKIISYYSFKGDLVLDPFAGIGTVGKAALKTGRLFYLIDIEKKYCEVAIKELGSDVDEPWIRVQFQG